jgi:hypothetical protein
MVQTTLVPSPSMRIAADTSLTDSVAPTPDSSSSRSFTLIRPTSSTAVATPNPTQTFSSSSVSTPGRGPLPSIAAVHSVSPPPNPTAASPSIPAGWLAALVLGSIALFAVLLIWLLLALRRRRRQVVTKRRPKEKSDIDPYRFQPPAPDIEAGRVQNVADVSDLRSTMAVASSDGSSQNGVRAPSLALSEHTLVGRLSRTGTMLRSSSRSTRKRVDTMRREAQRRLRAMGALGARRPSVPGVDPPAVSPTLSAADGRRIEASLLRAEIARFRAEGAARAVLELLESEIARLEGPSSSIAPDDNELPGYDPSGAPVENPFLSEAERKMAER